MPKAFVSCCDLEAPHAVAFVERSRAEGFIVSHSVPGMFVGRYGGDCSPVLEGTDVFVIVITEHYGFSCWMKAEAMDAATCFDAGKVRQRYVYNPRGYDVAKSSHLHIVGMEPVALFGDKLPDNLEEAIGVLKSS